jgi:hypothetical protein
MGQLALNLPVRVRVGCVPGGELEGFEVNHERTGHFGPPPYVQVRLTEGSWTLLKAYTPRERPERMSQTLWFPQERVSY